MAARRQTCVKRPIVGAELFGRSTVAVLAVLASGVSHAALALPSGASVQSGSVSLTRSPNLLTVNQSSQDAIINWSSFSIGAAGTVQFNNGAGATLNRVTGSDVSTIDGMLNATGSVYLINPNGVIIGKSGQVNVGGTFVASTLDLVDDNLDGATKTFTGSSGASITNLGSISALGGDVVLIANNVRNYGPISAPNGDIGLLAGSQILISDVATDDGKFSVQIGGPGTSVVNEGALQAAMVELRANQGNVYALAGNTGSVINATAVSATDDGQVFLVAEGGDTVVQGMITAAGPVGTTGGQVTTSGSTVSIAAANVTASNWTIEENGFVLTSAAAAALAANLATTSIIVQTVGAGATGDISLASSLSWSSNNSLTFSSRRNIVFRDGVTLSDTGYGDIILAADNEGHGIGSVSFGAGAGVYSAGSVFIFYDPVGNNNSSINTYSYTNPTDFSANISAQDFFSYMLVNTVYDLQNIQNNLSGSYALGRNIDASVTVNWNGGAGFTPIGPVYLAEEQGFEDSNGQQVPVTYYVPTPTPFTGVFTGQGYVIKDLTINMPTSSFVGLFSDIGQSGLVYNVKLEGGSVTGADDVGALAGQNAGQIRNASSNLPVTGIDYTGQGADGYAIGGLVGVNMGIIYDARATGNVSGYGIVGGLAGANYSGVYQSGANSGESYSGLIGNSSAGGNVSEGGGGEAGGLVGQSATSGAGDLYEPTPSLFNDHASGNVFGTYIVGGLAGDVNSGGVTNSYATGSVSAPGGSDVGGLIGYLGDVQQATVTYSHASGSVVGAYGVGGLIGEVDDSNDAEHVGFDLISNVFSTGNVSAVYFVGGLIGSLGNGRLNGDEPTLIDAYATGKVSGSGVTGGLIGFSSGNVTYSYWNTKTTGQSTDGAQATTPGDPTTGSIGLSGSDFWNTVKALGGF